MCVLLRRFVLLVICALPALLSAQQNTATLLGTVTDQSGATVPNAKVTVTDQQTAFTRSVQTTNMGDYLLALLPPAVNYQLTVEANGF